MNETTDSTAALNALRLKESALNATANGVVITGVDGKIQWVNSAACQLTGYCSDEVIGRNPRELVKSGKHDSAFYKGLWDTILTKQVWRGEIINRRKDGTLYHEEMTITPLLDESGEVTHFIAVKQDVSERVLMRQRLLYNEAIYRNLFENISSGVAVYAAIDNGEDFIFRDINQSVERLENVLRANVIGKRLTEVFPSVRDFGLLRILKRVFETGNPEQFPATLYEDKRVKGWRENYIYRLPTNEIVAVYDDVTIAKQSEIALRDSNQLMSSLLDSMAAGAYGVDALGTCTFVNKSFLRILGYQNESEIIGHHLHELIHHSHPDGTPYPSNECRMYEAYLQHQDVHCADEVFWRKDGVPAQVEYWSRPLLSDGLIVGAIATFIDIADRKKAEEEIKQLAFYDPLTKLPNRRLLNDRLSIAMASSQRNGLHGALMILDLDNFKSLNDTQGHLVGDLLLLEVARRLVSCVREMDTVSRFGGDEFVILLTELDANFEVASSQVAIVAEKIRASLSNPYMLEIGKDVAHIRTTIEHASSASIGVFVYLGNSDTIIDLLKWSDAAMYLAKESGRNAVRFHLQRKE